MDGAHPPDDTDSANGSATAVPFPRISLNVTAPDSMSVLGNYDDWLDILVTHEFVHIAMWTNSCVTRMSSQSS